jgi:hypothetical protein
VPYNQELESALGTRIDAAVDKVGGLLPLEWSSELRHVMRDIARDAYLAGAAQSHLVDAEMRKVF